MGLLDEAKLASSKRIGGSNTHFIDADTVAVPGGPNVRIQGLDSGEVAKVVGGELKEGTAGGYDTTQIVSDLARKEGFDNVQAYGTKAAHDRVEGDLINNKGESFRKKLLEAGAFDPTKYTNDQDLAAIEIAKARRHRDMNQGDYTSNNYDKAAAMIAQAEANEGKNIYGFKKTLQNEQARGQYINQFMASGMSREEAIAETDKFISTQTHVDNFDRDHNNNSANPFSDSWEQGWTGVGEAAFGVAEMLGAKAGAEGLEQWGVDGIERQRNKLAEYGNTILDYQDVDGFSSAIEYLGNNLALSLPYMAATVGATVAAPLTGGASYAVPVALYTGNTWNEMEGTSDQKSASWAIAGGVAQAALDKLGLDLVLPKGVAPKKIFNMATDGYVKKFGGTREAAKAKLSNATRRSIAELAGSATDIAKQQIKAKTIGMDLIKRAGTGALGEGATEAAQEATAYLAAVQGSEKQFDWNDLNHRLISAAIAGSSLGGGLSAPGAAFNAAGWLDVAHRTGPAAEQAASDAEQWAAEEKAKVGRNTSIEENLHDARIRAQSHPSQTLDEMSDGYTTAQSKKSLGDRAGEKLLALPGRVTQGSVANIFSRSLKMKSPMARLMSDTFGGSLQKTHHGSSMENQKHHRVSVYKNTIRTPDSTWKAMTGKEKISAGDKTNVSQQMYSIYQNKNYYNKDGVLDPNLIPENTPNRATIVGLAKEMGQLQDNMHADQKAFDPDLGYEKNYLFTYKGIDRAAIEKDTAGFKKALESNGISKADADTVVDNMLYNSEITDIDEAFSVTKGGIVPGSHKKRQLGIAQKPEFQKYLQQDIFANMSNAAKSAARFTTHREYIGKNGEVVVQMLNDMRKEGVSEAEVNKIAYELRDYFNAESGNYKRPTTDLGKAAFRVQKNFAFYTTVTGLPLATISSFVETMLTHKGLRMEQIVGFEGADGKKKTGSLESVGRELANTLWRGMKNVATVTTGNKAEDVVEARGSDILQDLGYYDWDVGAATTTGVAETDARKQRALEIFFSLSGLTGFTNFTRASRASIALDYMDDKADTIFRQRQSGKPRTREVQEAEEALRNLGIDVDGYVIAHMKNRANLPLDPQDQVAMEGALREGTFNFVNDAVALPQASNRPLIYQDPRFALFGQFQGFIATFTANHIPKLWGEYVKRGTPAMKYNAFALATTMIMMGFVSQHLKDLLKYGGTTPHLDDPKYFQRGVRASGLLGSSERILDQFFPLYDQRSEGAADWAFNGLIGESPGLGHLEKIGTAAGHALSGEGEKALYYGLKATPYAGPFTSFNKKLSGSIAEGEWKFGGE